MAKLSKLEMKIEKAAARMYANYDYRDYSGGKKPNLDYYDNQRDRFSSQEIAAYKEAFGLYELD